MNSPVVDRMASALQVGVSLISPIDWFVLHIGVWLAEVLEFDPMALDMFISMAKVGEVYPRSEWSRHVNRPAAELGPWPRRIFYKAVLIVAGFPLSTILALNSAFRWMPQMAPNGVFFNLIKWWAWRGAFSGVYLLPPANQSFTHPEEPGKGTRHPGT